jgi:hypothetical protein
MQYSNIEGFFVDSDTVVGVLEECSTMFNRIDEIGATLRDRGFNTPQELEGLIRELNGINIFLHPILGVAVSVKTENEDRFYNVRKIEIENAGEKFTSAAVDREASLAVANFRRVRNSLQAYVDVVTTLIMSAQSLLKNTERERQNVNG